MRRSLKMSHVLVLTSALILAFISVGWMAALFTGEVIAGPIVLEEGIATTGDSGGTSAIFLQIGIKGEALHQDHIEEIEVLGFSWGEMAAGIQQPTGGTGSGDRVPGRSEVSDFHLIKTIDLASPIIMEKCALGEHFPEAFITMHKTAPGPGGHVDYLTIEFTNVVCTSYSLGGAAEQFRPNEHISLDFTKVKVTYHRLDVGGDIAETTEGAYDLERRTRG